MPPRVTPPTRVRQCRGVFAGPACPWESWAIMAPTQDVSSVGRPVTPVVAHPRLARSRLVARLGQLPPGGVALLVAPAGYGATSLLALAAEQSNATPVWLSGPGGPSGYRQFWNNLAEALTRAGVDAPTPPKEGHPAGGEEFGSRPGRSAGGGSAAPAHRG